MGTAAQMSRWVIRPLQFLDRCRRELGDSFSVMFPGFETPMVMISHPDDVSALYRVPTHELPPGRSAALAPLLGERSILLLQGKEHLERRKLMLPPFHGDRMRAYEDVISEAIEREIATWPAGEEFALHPRMQAVTLEVILRAVFGVTDEARLEPLRRLLGFMLEQTNGTAIQLRFVASRRLGFVDDPLVEMRRALDEVDELIAAEVTERREDPNLGDREDILSLLVAARFEGGEPMSGEEIRDQLMTLLVAGHETTATALAWAMDMLLRNPAALARLREELVAGESEDYLRATITESLRLRPVVPIAGRRLTSELVLRDGTVLPPGTDVTPAIWLTHTRPEEYPDPHAFRPERHLDGSPSTYAWIPFGGGVRRCLGAAFAEMEMRVVLRAIVTGSELSPVGSSPERAARRNITFSPKRGTRVVLR